MGSGLVQGAPLLAQTAPPAAGAAAGSRVSGPVLRIEGQKLIMKDQQGSETTVTVTDTTKMVKIAPGQSSLAGATPIQLTDIQPGDRLLVRGQPGEGGSGMTAVMVIAMKKADIAEQQAKSQAAWQHGVGGIVKSVDAQGQSVVVTGAGGETTIKLASSTPVKRYAAESVSYERAQPSSIDRIMAGDQLRARGTAGADHTFQADEVVAGSFRNLSGKVTAVDTQAGMVSVADLATKQTVTVKVTDESQLRKLDDSTAEKLAEEIKASGAGAAGAGRGAGGPGGGGPPAGGPPRAAGGAAGGRPGMREGGGAGGADLQAALAHAAPVKLADLKKGDLVMVVASAGADNQLGAVTMVTNVEPLLRASPNGSAAMMSSWSLGGGGGVPAQ